MMLSPWVFIWFFRSISMLPTWTGWVFKFFDVYLSSICSSIFISMLPSPTSGGSILFNTVTKPSESICIHILLQGRQLRGKVLPDIAQGEPQLYHKGRFWDIPRQKITKILCPWIYYRINFAIQTTYWNWSIPELLVNETLINRNVEYSITGLIIRYDYTIFLFKERARSSCAFISTSPPLPFSSCLLLLDES